MWGPIIVRGSKAFMLFLRRKDAVRDRECFILNARGTLLSRVGLAPVTARRQPKMGLNRL
jgi:hypothetical protein